MGFAKSGIEYVDFMLDFGTTFSRWSAALITSLGPGKRTSFQPTKPALPAVLGVAEHALHSMRSDHLEHGLGVREEIRGRRTGGALHAGILRSSSG